MRWSAIHLDWMVDLVVLGLVYYFLSQYFPLKYLTMDTGVTGGDTGSHYKTAEYLKEVLLKSLQLEFFIVFV